MISRRSGTPTASHNAATLRCFITDTTIAFSSPTRRNAFEIPMALIDVRPHANTSSSTDSWGVCSILR
eukprot:161216-Rhodomonas_salina.1